MDEAARNVLGLGLYSQIRGVLIRDWDPISIADEPEAADEYDGYIPHIDGLLRSGASLSVIQTFYFRWFRTEWVLVRQQSYQT